METTDLYLKISKEITHLEHYAIRFTKNEENARDLLQDTMVKAFTNVEKFEKGTNLNAWLYVIMKNTFLNEYRRKTKLRSKVIQSEDISSANLSYSSTTNRGEQILIINDIKKALAVLPEEYYLPFIMHFEGFKYLEIAQKLKMPLGTVKTRIRSARRLLKESLKQYSESYTLEPTVH